MRYLSLCSGIEAATVAWAPLGWEPVAFAENDPFCSAVLRHHWPGVTNLGDVRKIGPREIRKLGRIDLVVGGTPLPDVSHESASRYSVRRLTPREAERLMGFPDDFTLVPYRPPGRKIERPAKDTPRYAALGNSIAVTHLEWIGRKLNGVL